MKLVFPGGEHPQVLLGPGVNRVGSDPKSNIVINSPGVMPQHCQLHVTAQGVMLDAPTGTAVSVNGREVDGLIRLRAGDVVAFNDVQARLSSLETAIVMPHNGVGPAPANDDVGATAIRPTLPKYVLRGVSGVAFGRSYGLHGTVMVGRAPECGLRLDEDGISRLHARVTLLDDGIQIEDLGSTNGTTVNGRRVMRDRVRAGDEIGFNTSRFRVVASGEMEPVRVEAIRRSAPQQKASSSWWPVWVAAIAVAAIVALAVI